MYIIKEFSKFKMRKSIISVYIQPEYEKFITFDLYSWVNYINEVGMNNDIIFLYNGYDTLGMVTESDYKEWLYMLGIDEEIIYNKATFYDKGYAFFRYCIDNSIDESDIIELVKYMIKKDVNDSRDIDWDDFMEDTSGNKEYVRNLLEYSDDLVSIPDLMNFLDSYTNIILMGGGIDGCLKEVEIALMSLDIKYEILKKFTY